jgi:hypothetical protein
MDARARDEGPDGNRERRNRRALERLRLLAQWFEQAFRIPGTRIRFGLDALFGLIPGVGDIAGGLVAVYALRVARNMGAPPVVQMHMLMNIALDALIGMIPLLGDVFDFVFEAQTMNLALLERWLQSPDRQTRRSRRGLIFVPLSILIVFATITALAIWMLVLLFQWIF